MDQHSDLVQTSKCVISYAYLTNLLEVLSVIIYKNVQSLGRKQELFGYNGCLDCYDSCKS